MAGGSANSRISEPEIEMAGGGYPAGGVNSRYRRFLDSG